MEKLKEQLDLHKEWLLDNTKGKKLDLRYANLRNTDLSGANLSGANLRYANLRYANLSGANLRYANLRYANLSGADLRGADLRYTNLRFADLRYCIGNNIEVKSLQLGTYLVSYTKELLNIGCQSHKHSDWRTFSDSVILDMEGERALDWWNLNKHIIFELIDREQNENN